MIDKIFIINLKHRTDRKENIINELKKQNITEDKYEFFNAIRPKMEDVIKWNKYYCNDVIKHVHPMNRTNYLIGCLGCLQSHREVIKLAIERDYNNILILEDDTEFIENFEKIYEYSQQINNDYDMLYLAGSHSGKNKSYSKNINKIKGTHTTGSYLIKRNTMEYMYENILGFEREVDVYYAKIIQEKFNCFCVTPHITKQKDGYSDIQNNNVKYNLK